MAKEIGMGIGAIHLAIQVLIDNKIIEKNADGEYFINKANLSGVQESERLQVFKKLNANVQKSEHFVQESEHPINIRRKENSKENSKETLGRGDFDAFWAEYPRKIGKVAALKAWAKTRPNLDTCLKALSWQKVQPQWTKDGGQFIPHASTWINQCRWADEMPKVGIGNAAAPKPGKYDNIGDKA